MSEANVALVQRLYSAFGRGEIDVMLGEFTHDATWEIVGIEKCSGPAAIKKQLNEFGEHNALNEFTITELCAAGDKVFTLGRVTITVKKTGRTVSSDFVHVLAIRDGKVTSFREFSDTAQIVEAQRS